MSEISRTEFVDRLKQHCSSETSADPKGWSSENLLWGHCAVVALLAQDLYGGVLVQGSLKEHQKYSYLRSHYWNKIPNGVEIDFTREQYPDLSFEDLSGEVRSRESVLEHPDTVRRYLLLNERMGI